MIDLHQEYVNKMMQIGDKLQNKEILDTTIAHIEALQGLVKKPVKPRNHNMDYTDFQQDAIGGIALD